MSTKWYETPGENADTSVSTRVRLARNLRQYPFPCRMNSEQAEEIIARATEAVKASPCGADFELIRLDAENRGYAMSLAERHVISPEFAASEGPHALLLSRDEGVAIMINEEDHLRIQTLGSGLCPEKCLERAQEIDTLLDGALPYAFDERLGYLTQCPTNLGTGLRGSVMLHLPAVTESGAARGIIAAAGKLGFAVRGMYGEGTSAEGALYQISNQLTLGFTEEELLGRISDTVKRVIVQEEAMREEMRTRDPKLFEDRVWRAYGLLLSARLMTSGEATALLSTLRLGVSMGIIDKLTTARIDRLIWEIQPAQMQLLAEQKEDKQTGFAHGRDFERARVIREAVS